MTLLLLPQCSLAAAINSWFSKGSPFLPRRLPFSIPSFWLTPQVSLLTPLPSGYRIKSLCPGSPACSEAPPPILWDGSLEGYLSVLYEPGGPRGLHQEPQPWLRVAGSSHSSFLTQIYFLCLLQSQTHTFHWEAQGRFVNPPWAHTTLSCQHEEALSFQERKGWMRMRVEGKGFGPVLI